MELVSGVAGQVLSIGRKSVGRWHPEGPNLLPRTHIATAGVMGQMTPYSLAQISMSLVYK